MFFYPLAGVVALIWLWACVALYGKGKQWSPAVRYGGTLLFAVAALSVGVGGYRSAQESAARDRAPASFAEAGLEEKWTAVQFPLAAAITVRKLNVLRHDLEWAFSIGDRLRAEALVAPIADVVRSWESQEVSGQEQYRPCLHAAIHLQTGVEAARQARKEWPEAQFKRALARCGDLR